MSDPLEQLLAQQAGLANLPDRINAALPGAVITSGRRSPAEQQALIARGATTAAHSPHVSGNGFDVRPIDGMSPQDALARLQQSGLPVTQVIDETTQGTGPHWHFAGDLGGQMPVVDQRGAPAQPPAVPKQSAQPDDLEALLAQQASAHEPAPSQQASAAPVLRLQDLPDHPPEGWINYFGEGMHDGLVGAAQGLADVAGTGGWLADKAAGAIGLDTGFQNWVDRKQDWLDTRYYDPNGDMAFLGRLGSDVGATLPIAEIKAIQIAPEMSALSKGLRLAAQGGLAGAELSGGHSLGNVLGSAAGGAITAPIVHAAVAPVLRRMIAAKNSEAAQQLAQKLRTMLPGAESEGAAAAAPEALDAASDMAPKIIRKGGDLLPDGSLYVEITPNDAPTTADLSKALGSRGARRGLVSNTDLPPDVAASVQQLTSQGVPLDQAMREAEATAIGAKPTVADVTRDFGHQQAINEGAKLDTPEGRAMQAQQIENNAATHRAVQDLVQSYGGVPEQGEAMGAAADALAKSSDAERKAVKALYQKADEEVGNVGYIDVSGLRQALNSPDMANPTIEGARTLRNGVLGLIDAYSPHGEKITAGQAEQIRQAIGMAYDPMGGSINQVVGGLKNGLDHAMDQEVVSAPYKAARAAHKAWADKYDNPAGVSDLIQRDAKGNFVGAARKLDRSMLGSMDDRPFVNIVNRLRANGNADVIDKLKASVIQGAYEKASRAAPDAGNHATLNGRMFLEELDKLGKAKLDALFSPQEQALLASRGRAAIVLNERVPGTVNTSNTASSYLRLSDALARSKKEPKPSVIGKGLKVGSHLVLGGATHGVGNVALEAASEGAKAVTAASRQAKLAEAMREAMSPAAARKAASRHAEALRRHAQGGRAAERVAGGSAAALSSALKRRLTERPKDRASGR